MCHRVKFPSFFVTVVRPKVMKSILDVRPQLHDAIWDVAEVAGYLWEKGWAERNGGNITVNITEHVDDAMRDMPSICEPKPIGTVLPQLKGCWFYCKGTQKRMRDLARDALSILKYNTEYPVSKLDNEYMNRVAVDNYKREILDSSEISIKYKGYIQREQQMADKIMRLENLIIPDGFDFDRVESLSIECRQKLKRYSPRTIAQASRISGVSPSDISVLLVYFGR